MASQIQEAVHPVTASKRQPLIRRFGQGPVPWLIPALIVLLIVSLYPLVFAIINSFRFYNLGVAAEPGNFIGTSHYENVLTSSSVHQALWNTLVFAFTVTTVELVLGVLLALLLRERLVGVNLARAILIMPVAIAPAIAGLAFRSMYTPGTGLVPVLMERLGIAVPEAGILGDTSTAMPALMITDIWQWTPFVALIALAAMQGVPSDVVEAARMDGAGTVRILRSITLPLIAPALATIALLRFIQSFNVFDIVYVETRGGPGGSTTTLGFEVFMAGLNNYNIGYASALTVVAAVVVGIFINIYFISSNWKRGSHSA